MKWTKMTARAEDLGELKIFQRPCDDGGHLTVFVSREPFGPGGRIGWHLSISHRVMSDKPGRKTKPGRYPTWDEIVEARDAFVPNWVYMVQLLPPREQRVNIHETTFHLWETWESH